MNEPCPAPEAATPAAKECCKCAAYREIISMHNAQMAEMRRQLQQGSDWAGHVKNHLEKALQAAK